MPPWLIFALLGGVVALAVLATDGIPEELEYDWDLFIAAHTELHS